MDPDQRGRKPRVIGLILAGAVTKGAFEAGALKVLATRNVYARRILGASSGALNAAIYAAGVRAGREQEAADDLAEAWSSQGGWYQTVSFSLRAILARRGLSDQDKLRALLRRNMQPIVRPDPVPVDLHLVVAPLRGTVDRLEEETAPSYTSIVHYCGESFDTEQGVEEVITGAVASAALPVLYAPVKVPGLGSCIDGGLVDGGSFPEVLGPDGGASLDGIVVIAPAPASIPPRRGRLRGVDLINHVVEMIFSERIYLDLRESHLQSRALRRLAALGRLRGWSPEQYAEMVTALDFRWRRALPIITIRPVLPLPGTLLSGFYSASTRRRYVEIGIERANSILDEYGWE